MRGLRGRASWWAAAVVLVTPMAAPLTVGPAKAAPSSPVVSSVSVRHLPRAGGTRLTVRGTGFGRSTRIRFGSVRGVRVVVRSSRVLQVTAPPHAAGTVDVRATSRSRTSGARPADRVTFHAPPVVRAVTPASGTTAGGAVLTVVGSGFDRTSRVTIGGTRAGSVRLVSGTRLTARAPARPPGMVAVRVSGYGGWSSVSTRSRYTAVRPTSSPSPTPTTPMPPARLAAPSALVATVLGTTTVRLDWTPSTDQAATSYVVTADGRQGETSDSRYYLRGLTAGRAVDVAVLARDDTGRRSAASTRQVTTAATDAGGPGRVSQPTGTDVGPGAVALAWTPPADKDITGYVATRREDDAVATGPTDGTPVRLDGPGRRLTDWAARPGTHYTYTVFARDGSDHYGPGVPVAVTTPAASTLPPVTDLRATLGDGTGSGRTDSVVRLSWQPPADNGRFSGVVVRRQAGTTPPSSPASGQPVVGPSDPNRTYDPAPYNGAADHELQPGTTYSYAVFVVDPDRHFSSAATATATTATTHDYAVAGSLRWSRAQVPDPNLDIPSAPSCPTTTFCIAVSQAGNYVTFDGHAWLTEQVYPRGVSLKSVSCATATSCIAVGDGAALRFDGTRWSAPQQITPVASLAAVSCPAVDFCAAIDNGDSALLYDGTSWTPITRAHASGSGYFAFVKLSCGSSHLCVSTTGATFDGTSWRATSFPSSSGASAVSCTADDFCMGADEGAGWATFDGRTWSSNEGRPAGVEPSVAAFALDCRDKHSCSMLIGPNLGPAVLTWTDGTWDAPRTVDNRSYPTGFDCTDADDCTVLAFRYDGVGEPGPAQLVTAARSMAGTWAPAVDVLRVREIVAVSCATTDDCVMVDSASRWLSSHDGVWSRPAPVPGLGRPTALSCASATFCVAVDNRGRAAVRNGADFAGARSVDPDPLLSVSCPAPGHCVAVDDGGNALRYDDGTWTRPVRVSPDDNSGLDTLSCSSMTYCVAASAYFGGGYVLDGTTWTHLEWSAFGPVSCTGSRRCLVANTPFYTVNVRPIAGSAWAADDRVVTNLGYQTAFTAMSCLGPDFCVLGSGSSTPATGDVVQFTPTTANSWDQLPGIDSVRGVSCAGASCTLFDGAGGVSRGTR